MHQPFAELLAAWLGVWLVLTAVAQVLPRQASIRRSWFSWALPEWRFFAPNPATSDFVLFHRQYLGPICWMSFSGRAGWHGLWNPPGRRQKVFRDLVIGLQLAVEGAEGNDPEVPDAVCESPPYAALLSYCFAQHPKDRFVQFGIACQTVNEPDEIIFVSRWHACH